jgi:hypothetical protein
MLSEIQIHLHKHKTTRTFEHRGEAWRVLVVQRYCFNLE